MKNYQATQKNLAMIGISKSLTMQKYPFNGRILMSFLVHNVVLVFFSLYAIYDADSFAEYIQCAYAMSLTIEIIAGLIILMFQADRLFDYIEEHESLMDYTLKYTATKSIYYEAAQFEEKSSRFIFYFMAYFTPVFAILPRFGYCFYIYFTTDLGNDSFELPFPIWFPFDWKNPIGYLIAMAIEYVVLWDMLMIASCMIALAFGSYLYGNASSKCVKGALFAFGRCSSGTNSHEEVLECFTEFVEFHSRVKQLSILLLWSLITISGALLLIQMILVQDNENLAVLVIILFEIVYAFGVLFIACELGQRVNLAYEECNDMIDQFEWYLFPIEIQRLLPFVMSVAQQPIDIKTFGSTALNRAAFKYIIKTSYSYFTVLREFYN